MDDQSANKDDEDSLGGAVSDVTPVAGLGEALTRGLAEGSVDDETPVSAPRIARTFPSLQLFTSIEIGRAHV